MGGLIRKWGYQPSYSYLGPDTFMAPKIGVAQASEEFENFKTTAGSYYTGKKSHAPLGYCLNSFCGDSCFTQSGIEAAVLDTWEKTESLLIC